jgi:hypothetical protein
MNVEDIYETSAEVLDFDTEEKILLENKNFLMAWGIARQKATETIHLAKCLMLIKNKYKINDFEFELLMGGFDGENLLGNE